MRDAIAISVQLIVACRFIRAMTRYIPYTYSPFGPSLVTADMGNIYDGVSSLTIHDHALARFLNAKEAADLDGIMSQDEKLRRFFFGLDIDLPWDETLLLIRGIWTAFGLKGTDWKARKADMLERHIHNGRLKNIIDRFGVGP